jgi:hypothetical protein
MLTLRITVLLIFGLQLPASNGLKTITRNQARELLLQALQKQGYPIRASNFELDNENDKYFPNFYTFHSYSNSKSRLVSTGIFAVNKRTADVWDELLCHKIDLPEIKPLQGRLRKQTETTDIEYATLTKEAPCRVD